MGDTRGLKKRKKEEVLTDLIGWAAWLMPEQLLEKQTHLGPRKENGLRYGSFNLCFGC